MFCKTMKLSLFQMLLFAGKQIWPPPPSIRCCQNLQVKRFSHCWTTKIRTESALMICGKYLLNNVHDTLKNVEIKKFDCKLLWIKCLIKFLALFSFYSAQGFWKCSMTVEKINGKGWHPVCHILCCFFFLVFNIN